MRLFILGATGGTGRAFLDQARERGHQITAFVRSPQKLGPAKDGITVRLGDPRNVAELRAALAGGALSPWRARARYAHTPDRRHGRLIHPSTCGHGLLVAR